MMGGLGLRETYRASSLPVLNYCGVWFCSHLLSSTWEITVFSLDTVHEGNNKTLSVWPLQRETQATPNTLSQLLSFYYFSHGDDMLHLCSQPSSQDQHHFWQKLKSFRFELWKYSVTCTSFSNKAQHQFQPEVCCLTKPCNWTTCTGRCGVNSQIHGRGWVVLAFLMKIIIIFCSKESIYFLAWNFISS